MSYLIIIPNFVTLLSLISGLLSITSSIQGDIKHSIFFIMIAAVCDALDGLIARILKQTSLFGKHFDSLCDATAFGIAPFILLYSSFVESVVTAFCIYIYTATIMLRLARFNVDTKEENNFFYGIPSPVAAFLSLFPIVSLFCNLQLSQSVLSVYLLVISALIISAVPTFSIKTIFQKKFPALMSSLALTISLCVISFLSINIWTLYIITGTAYLMSIPLSIWSYKNK